MGIIIYPSKEALLKSIGEIREGGYKSGQFDFHTSSLSGSDERLVEVLDPLVCWLEENLKPIVEDRRSLFNITCELVRNAFDSLTPQNPSGSYEVFLGQENFVIGTRQDGLFFTPEQIRKIITGEEILSTKRRQWNMGNSLNGILRECNGLLLLPSTKEFYLSRTLKEYNTQQ